MVWPTKYWLRVDILAPLGQRVAMTPRSELTRATVGEIMTSPVTTVGLDAAVAEARSTLLNSPGSALPIVNSRHEPVGILTKSDLVAHVDDSLPVAVLMSQDLVVCQASTSVWAAARQMRAEEIHHLVVVDQQGVLTGILSVFDLLALLDDIEPVESTTA